MSLCICQRCYGDRDDGWFTKQAEFHVGKIEHWKVQLCRKCAEAMEQAVLAALKSADDHAEG